MEHLVSFMVFSVKKIDPNIGSIFTLYSHSIVDGGLVVISYTTLFTCRTSFTILEDIFSSTSKGILAHWAVMASVLFTALFSLMTTYTCLEDTKMMPLEASISLAAVHIFEKLLANFIRLSRYFGANFLEPFPF